MVPGVSDRDIGRNVRAGIEDSERIQLPHHIDHVSTGGRHRDFCAQCDDASLLADLTQTRMIDLVECEERFRKHQVALRVTDEKIERQVRMRQVPGPSACLYSAVLAS